GFSGLGCWSCFRCRVWRWDRSRGLPRGSLGRGCGGDFFLALGFTHLRGSCLRRRAGLLVRTRGLRYGCRSGGSMHRSKMLLAGGLAARWMHLGPAEVAGGDQKEPDGCNQECLLVGGFPILGVAKGREDGRLDGRYSGGGQSFLENWLGFVLLSLRSGCDCRGWRGCACLDTWPSLLGRSGCGCRSLAGRRAA